MTASPGELLRRKPDDRVPYDLPAKDRAPVARLVILGWGEPSVPVHQVERKLAAIFAADIAGYSQLMARVMRSARSPG